MCLLQQLHAGTIFIYGMSLSKDEIENKVKHIHIATVLIALSFPMLPL